MTIRVVCQECDSVLKINDDLAGKEVKCPKCRAPFRVPQRPKKGSAKPKPAAAAVAAADAAPAPAAAQSLDGLVDMPREVTPQVSFASLEDRFDPQDVLSSDDGKASGNGSVGSVSAEAEKPRPSIEELMLEHQAKQKGKKKKLPAKKEGGEASAASAAAAAESFTSGSATDALTRTYDQKRGRADAPAPMTREEQRAAEEKEAMKAFAIRAGAGIGGLAVVLFFLVSWMMSDPLPDLEYVTGVVLRDGRPLPKVEITFAPMKSLDGKDLENAVPSTGYTDESGKFEMMYNPDTYGVVPGIHRIIIRSASGIEYRLPTNHQEKTVTPGEDNTFEISM